MVLVGPAEELIFHGVIQQSLEDVIGLWPAIFPGGMLFGVTHIDPAALSSGDLLFYGVQGGFGVIVDGFMQGLITSSSLPSSTELLFRSQLRSHF